MWNWCYKLKCRFLGFVVVQFIWFGKILIGEFLLRLLLLISNFGRSVFSLLTYLLVITTDFSVCSKKNSLVFLLTKPSNI